MLAVSHLMMLKGCPNEAQHCRANVLSETRKTIQGIKLLFKCTIVPKLPIETKKILRGQGNLLKSTIVGKISIWDETKILLHGRGYLTLHFKHAEFEKGESSLFRSDSLCLFKVDVLVVCCVSGIFLRYILAQIGLLTAKLEFNNRAS